MGLTFDEVAFQNRSRAMRWRKGGLDEWSVSDWAVAFAGEAGEVCDAVKKLNRIDHKLHSENPRQPQTRAQAIADIAKEIGDTAIYLDLLAQRLGLSLEDCVRTTFNRISDREGLPEKL